MTAISDYPDWQTPQAHATAIAATGTPLLALSSVLDHEAVFVQAGQSLTLGPYTFAQLGYELSLSVQESAPGNAAPVCYQLSWIDSVTNLVTWVDKYWVLAAAQGNPATVLGHGIARADTLSLSIINTDTAEIEVGLVLAQNSRVTAHSDWRSSVMGTIAGQSPSNSDPAGGLICATSPNLAGNASQTRLLPLYSGLVTIHAVGGANVTTWSIQSQDPSANPAQGVVGGTVPASAHTVIGQCVLPQAQCVLLMNNTAAGVSSPAFTITATPA